MVKKPLLFLLVLFQTFCGLSQTETLRHFDPANSSYLYPSGFNMLVARFEPEAPGMLTKVRVKLGGTSASGSVEMTVFGHEGGTSFPQLEKPLFPWVTLSKTVIGEEWASFDLPTPLNMDNNQFFVAFKNLKNGAKIYADNKPAAASCRSSSGGDYYFIFLKTLSNTWALGNKLAFAVEAELNYSKRKGEPLFKDVTASLGIDTNQGNSVIAWADLDQDGFQDLMTATNIYKNEGGLKFTDITSSIGYKGSNAAMFLDVNNDGKMDILAFYPSGDSGTYYKNEGNLAFTRLKATGLRSLPSISSFSAADLDKDGYPEIFTGQLWGAYPEPYPNYLFKNNGDGSFTDITKKLYPGYDGNSNFPNKVVCKSSDASTYLSNGNTNRRSRGSAFCDFDNDGDMDLYITNYFLEPDEFYRNNGDGSFTDIIAQKGIDKNLTGSNHGTGIDFGDYNNDGNFDILLPQFSHPAFALQYDHRNTTIYKNTGAPDFNFTDLNPNNEMVNPMSGLAYEETYAGGSWGDVNNDGLLDFFMSVFYGCRYVKLFIQNPDHTFKLQTYAYGLQKLNTGEDVTWVDYNNDGALDLCAGNAGRIRLFKTEIPNTNRFLSLDLRTSTGNTFAIGSKVIVHAGGQKISRQITAGRGVRHQSAYRLHFGIGNLSLEKVEIIWPDGSIDNLTGFVSNHHYTIEQGKPVEGLSQTESELRLLAHPGSETSVQFLTKTSGKLKLTICDATGRIIKTLAEETIDPGANTYLIYSETLSEGIYWVQAIFEGKVFAKKWLKMDY